jgi:hypothetical protein
MSVNVVKTSETKELPFFARFLEEQAAKEPNHKPEWAQTLKYPSDWEEY